MPAMFRASVRSHLIGRRQRTRSVSTIISQTKVSAGSNVIESGASSASEVLFGLLDQDKISKAVAECLYTGIAHDTGVFKYSNTSRKTMDIAGS